VRPGAPGTENDDRVLEICGFGERVAVEDDLAPFERAKVDPVPFEPVFPGEYDPRVVSDLFSLGETV
jgi:hypothetical protein